MADFTIFNSLFVKSDGFFDKKYHFTSQNFNFVLKNTPDSVDDFKTSEEDTVESGDTLTYTVLMGGDTVSKTEVGTITYTYTKDVVYYTVTFYDENGETELGTGSYEENTAVTIPADPTKAEDENNTYAFAGWKVKGAEDSTAVKLTELTATANTEYVAVYTATPKVPEGGEDTDEFTVTFSVEGTQYAQTTTVGGVPQLPTTEPTKEANGDKRYTFIGWYTDEECTVKLDKTAVVSENITLYAKMYQIPVFGDINGDGLVKANDYNLFKSYNSKGTSNYAFNSSIPHTYNSSTSAEYVFGDINGDGSVKANDYNLFKSYNSKGTSNYPFGSDYDVVKD